ncbi:MAG: efflux RND transporter permease subunit, partial [Deltaproteobacteria bacterium]|nr:efflux RND transporter permease subunit [Deltaproteobacteria bacterium]
LCLAGITGYRELPVAALPQVDYPTIVITTQLPGASAETIASSITTPLERTLGQVPSLAEMTSISSYGSSQITLQFTLERDIDGAEQDVQAAINAATNLLPRGILPAPPTYAKSNPADQPILTLAVSSQTLELAAVSDYADSVLAQKISQVEGVGLVTMGGGQKPAVRVQVDPVALAGTGLTLEDVRSAIASANVNLPKGNIDGPRQDYALATNDQLGDAKTFEPLIIAYRNGSVVRLGEVARVIDGVENAQLAAWSGPQRAVILNIQRQPNANIIDVAANIKELLPRLRASMPQAIDVEIVADRTVTVRASVEDVEFTLLLTLCLVVAVIYLFLGSLRATVIPGVAVPLALIGTFGVMWLIGYSLNNLSLMALTISTGFIVDDAIVMVENVMRHIEKGTKPFEAALIGAKQIGFTIVSLTVSLIAVLIPLLFMGGLIGRLFREFAVTLAIAIGISAVLTLTLTAMMCAWLLRPHTEPEPYTIAGLFDRLFNAVTRFYERTLAVVIRFRVTTLLVTIATAVLTAVLAMIVPKGFFPQQDTGMITGVSEAAPDISFERLRERQQALVEILRSDPDVASVTTAIGADGINPAANVGRFSIALVPLDDRDASVTDVIARLQNRAHEITGLEVYFQPVQDLQIDARVSRTQFQYTLEDSDPVVLSTFAPKLLAAMRALPELANVASDRQGSGLQLHVAVDRDSAARLGVTQQHLDDILYDAFGQRIVSTTFTQLNQYRVILEIRPEDRETADALDKLYVRTSAGNAVPLSQIARFETRTAPLAIAHQGQFPSVTLSFDTAPDVSLGAAIAEIERVTAQLEPPSTMRASFTGAAKAFGESLASTPFLIFAALITVYIVLGVLYESYIHPITILSTLPSAGVGAILALFVVGQPFDVIALIGVVLLIGIVQKNAIMMIDFALDAERDGMAPEQAIHQAALLRFRPIMMTTMAALLGGLPLALGSGMGAELRRPLGITIVGGLLLSQVLTLYTTPVVYLFTSKLRRKPKTEEAPPTPAEPVP